MYETNFYESGYSRISSSSAEGTAVAGPGSDPLGFTISVDSWRSDLRSPNLQQYRSVNSGSLGLSVIMLSQEVRRSDGWMAATVTFDRPVTDLQFWILDIDRTITDDGGWHDEMYLEPTPTVDQRGSGVRGVGTESDMLRAVNNGTNTDYSDPAGWARITYPGEITSFTITYRSREGTAVQNIMLTDMSFSAPGCA